jgi:hypothetical protein
MSTTRKAAGKTHRPKALSLHLGLNGVSAAALLAQQPFSV